MLTAIAIIFVLAYVAIALEHPLQVNKTAVALLAAGLMWAFFMFAPAPGAVEVLKQLDLALGGTASIVFFLIGSMVIVEVADAHGAFDIITEYIKTTKLSTLLWIISLATFFLSSVLANMTTAIVMVSLVKRLLKNREDRLIFAGMIVIASNAGGAWTVIGDTTTTMLWIGKQVTPIAIMKALLLPSIVSLLLPVTVASFMLKGNKVEAPEKTAAQSGSVVTEFEKRVMFVLGIGSIMAVPVIQFLTGIPPYLGVLFSLGVVWFVGDLMHRKKADHEKENLTMTAALRRSDMTSVMFFTGILLAVATMTATGQLPALAVWLGNHIGNQSIIVILIGLVSAVVDNIPLIAASMGMYPLGQYPADTYIWEMLAYCAGTGGSILIIGSAAGVATMGLEKIEFFWYARKIAPLALLGYFGGVAVYMIQYKLMHG